MTTSSVASLPVRRRDESRTQMPRSCVATRQPPRTSESRQSKYRRWTSTINGARPPKTERCGLFATTSGNSEVLDTLVPNPASFQCPLQPNETKPVANGRRKRRSFRGRERDAEGNSGKKCLSTIRELLTSMFEASDNKLAMKLYGNRNALMKERKRQRATNNWVIHPCSDFR